MNADEKTGTYFVEMPDGSSHQFFPEACGIEMSHIHEDMHPPPRRTGLIHEANRKHEVKEVGEVEEEPLDKPSGASKLEIIPGGPNPYIKSQQKEYFESRKRLKEMEEENLIKIDYDNLSDGSSSPQLDDVDVTPPGSEMFRTSDTNKEEKNAEQQDRQDEFKQWQEWQNNHTTESGENCEGKQSKSSSFYPRNISLPWLLR